jgi:hypothetical protein
MALPNPIVSPCNGQVFGCRMFGGQPFNGQPAAAGPARAGPLPMAFTGFALVRGMTRLVMKRAMPGKARRESRAR